MTNTESFQSDRFRNRNNVDTFFFISKFKTVMVRHNWDYIYLHGKPNIHDIQVSNFY